MLGDFASIATLILFVIYFIGRIITIFRTKALYSDEVNIETVGLTQNHYDIVDSIELEENPYNSFILTSRQGIYRVKVYKLKYDKGLNYIGKKENVYEYPFLNIGQSLEFRLTIPDVLTKYELEYIASDFRKVSVRLIENAKNGVVSQSARVRHTFKSVLYYMFK